MTGDRRKCMFDWRYVKEFALDELTTYPEKAKLYALEATFRETLYECTAEDSPAELGSRVRTVGLGLLRPDAIARRRVAPALDYFRRLGIRPFFCTEVDVSPATVREVWRYQFNVASGERLRLLDLLFGATPSILVLFQPDPCRVPVPTTVVMADSKGEADPGVREGWELRSQLGSPHRIEVYMHVADEPIDVVRDGGILLGPQRFGAALRTPLGDVTDEVVARAERIQQVLGPGARRLRALDPLLQPFLTGGDRGIDRWDTLRHLGKICEMYGGPGENIICESGTDPWWERAGLLAQRKRFLSMQHDDAGGEPDLAQIGAQRLVR